MCNIKVSNAEYIEARDKLQDELKEIDDEIALHTVANKHFEVAVVTILSIGKDLKNVFKSSKVDTKREILNFLLSNLKINDGNLSYTWNFPFSKLRDFRHFSNWRE